MNSTCLHAPSSRMNFLPKPRPVSACLSQSYTHSLKYPHTNKQMRIPHPSRSLFSVAQRYLSTFTFFSLKPLSQSSLRTLASTMASENFSSDATSDVVADEVKFGFQRSEMYSSNLAGTVDPYDRHVFLSYKSYDSWPPRVENSDTDLLPKLLSDALKSRKNDINVKTRLTICEGRDGSGLSDGDVLIFPEMIKYRGLKESDVDGFVDDVLVNGKPWASGVQEVLIGSHVFVCAHNKRDRRCGVCGPVLIEKFKEEMELKGLEDEVFVTACSHVGGHKYAGNVIIFSADSEGKISGHWYGYVTPDDVPDLLDQHIGKGEVIERLWRGQMGGRAEEADKLDEHKLPNGEALEHSETPQENGSEEKRESVANCCQGGTGFSCCRDESLEEKQGKNGPVRLTTWVGKWEQREVLTAAAVVGAVATVAVAYSFYRRSK
ncbi:unnamed protein product [Ilex paraguariensis]|uniref:Altered inheritance of mitochondria protein 32 n=1 Tax=Ilex paraguariensis TaxID=185542 RepID=A0ABC8U3E3_9AQUA